MVSVSDATAGFLGGMVPIRLSALTSERPQHFEKRQMKLGLLGVVTLSTLVVLAVN